MYIYKITSKINGKMYIGLKSVSPEKSLDYYGSGVAIGRAIRKYGKENFTKEILERDIESIEKLFEAEKKWIALYDSKNKGYNMTDGGDGVVGNKLSEEVKARISMKKKGVKLSEEHKQKLSKAGEGRIFSEESKRKLSLKKQGVKKSGEHKSNLSKAGKGRIVSEEVKEKLKNMYKGRKRDANMKWI